MKKMSAIPQNYKNNVNWILGAYTDAGVEFSNGFQKDAIQNAVGARKNNHWKNDWSCDISIINNNKGKFLVIEDCGTVGLTGKNLSSDEIKDIMAKNESLSSEERLARFTSMFNSGGNTTGGGLFGAGKSVYSVASEEYTYYFDSLTEDGNYVANMNKCGQVFSTALEDYEAKRFIYNHTGLYEKKKIGTRIIILNPKKELVNDINNKKIIGYIQESWWLILQKMNSNSFISVNGEKIGIPCNIKNGIHNYELDKPEKYNDYRVKHFGLFIFKNENDCAWNGISYYRKGMKIGEIILNNIPKKLEKKFWGYIEVDELWEDDLADIEDKVHFGVSKGKKHTKTYQDLKNYCNEKINKLLIDWGYIKDKENEDKKLREELQQIAEEIQDLFESIGFEDLGKGPKKPDFDVRWKNIKYPQENNIEVVTNDKILFSFVIKNGYKVEKNFEWKLNIVNPDTNELISQFKNGMLKIKSNEIKQEDFSFLVNKDTAAQYFENRIVLSVKVKGSNKEKVKQLPFFYDITKPKNQREIVDLSLHTCDFPREGSRRVNFNEYISNISYRIENRRSEPLNYRLNINIHNASDATMPKIKTIGSFEGIIDPYEEIITGKIENIFFEKGYFEKYLSEGVLELRAKLIAKEDDFQFEKGDKITFYNYKIFFNKDEKNGKYDSFDVKCMEAPDKYQRSWFENGTNRTIFINLSHAAYLNVVDYPEIRYEYMREQMLKQYVLLYLNEGKFSIFDQDGQEFSKLEPQEAVEKVINVIENIYYRSFK